MECSLLIQFSVGVDGLNIFQFSVWIVFEVFTGTNDICAQVSFLEYKKTRIENSYIFSEKLCVNSAPASGMFWNKTKWK